MLGTLKHNIVNSPAFHTKLNISELISGNQFKIPSTPLTWKINIYVKGQIKSFKLSVKLS